jgi:hypothetical protein
MTGAVTHDKESSERLKRYQELLVLRCQPWAKDRYPGKEQIRWESIAPSSPQELESVLQGLSGPQLAVALAHAGFCGDREVGQRLIDIHGPIETHLEVKGSQTFLNDEPLHYAWAMHYLRNAESPEAMAEVMEWLPTVGLGWMVGVGSEHCVMFEENTTIDRALKQVIKPEFEGALPSLVNGRIEQPELLLALHERNTGTHYPKAYQKILLWVPERTVAQFPDDLTAYKSVQTAYFRDQEKHARPDQSVTLPLTEVEPVFLDQVHNWWASASNPDRPDNGLSLQNIILRTASTRATMDLEGDMLLVHQANQAIQLGFWGRPGMVLCESTVDFLSQFDIGPQEPSNTLKSQAYVQAYAPIDLMIRAYGDKSRENAMNYIRRYGFELSGDTPRTTFNKLVGLLNSPEPFATQIRGVLNKPLMAFLTSNYGDKHAWASTLVTLHREYGINNDGIAITIDGDDVETLYDGGFRFADSTLVDLEDPVGNRSDILNGGSKSKLGQVTFKYDGMGGYDDARILEVQVKAQRLGLWLSDVKKPASVAESLTSVVKRKIDNKKPRGTQPWYLANSGIFAHKAFLAEAGPEACAQVAKTEKHWHVLNEVFGVQVLKPYMKDTSLQIVGALFSKDLGL